MRCKFRDQASTTTQCPAITLRYTLKEYRQWAVKKTQMATLMVFLGLGGGFWVASEAIAPQIAQADTDRVELSLERQPNETYETLVSRAEAAAVAAAQASFDQDNQITDVSVVILAQNQGVIAPVLSLEASRSEWLSSPDAQRWSTYFTNARSLLRLEELATANPSQSGTANPSTQRQPANTVPAPAGTFNPATQRQINTIPTPLGTTTPATTSGQPTNNSLTQQGTTTPATTPGQSTNNNSIPSGTTNSTIPSSQTPSPGSGLSPQPATAAPVLTAPSNPMNPTETNSVSPSFPWNETSSSSGNNPAIAPTTPNDVSPGNTP